MQITRPILALIAALLLPALSNSASAAEPEFTIIGQLGSRVSIQQPRGFVRRVSADGTTIVGDSYFSGTKEAFRWTEEFGMELLGDLPGWVESSGAHVVSPDGLTVYGSSAYQPDGFTTFGFSEGFIWTEDTGMDPIRSILEAAIGEPIFDVSDDGSRFLGRAVILNTNGSEIHIAGLPGGSFGGVANSLSADGKRAAGNTSSVNGTEAFLWDEVEGSIGLGSLPGRSFLSNAYDISADGSTVIGMSYSDLGREAFAWTEETGMVGLGNLQLYEGDGGDSEARAVSGDGSIVVGTVRGMLVDEPFIWVKNRGMLRMLDLLDNAGIDYSGLREFSAADVSDDGRVIVGTAYSVADRYKVGWRLEIELVPEPSAALLTLLACLSVSTNRKAAQVCSFGN